jgi:hypothetical protein
LAGIPVRRRELGLPDDWSQVKSWCRGEARNFSLPAVQKQKKLEKDWGIADYSAVASPSFWKGYPSRCLPVKPTTRISTRVLAKKISVARNQWTVHQKHTAESAYKIFNGGGQRLPGM